VASGLGITILPHSAAVASHYAMDSLVVKPFAGTAPKRTVALAWRASFPRHKAVDVLRDAIHAARAELAAPTNPLY
jgi:LysR family hydrogen peroxide-inducible transcriptional activator